MPGWYSQRAKCLRVALLSLLLFAMPAAAKIVVDFDPGVEFSKFKTFAYIGGVDGRLYILEKITNSDKIWKQADKQVIEGFKSFPPSAKEVQAKQKEREEHKPVKANTSF